jgi:hypothetical protein
MASNQHFERSCHIQVHELRYDTHHPAIEGAFGVILESIRIVVRALSMKHSNLHFVLLMRVI